MRNWNNCIRLDPPVKITIVPPRVVVIQADRFATLPRIKFIGRHTPGAHARRAISLVAQRSDHAVPTRVHCHAGRAEMVSQHPIDGARANSRPHHPRAGQADVAGRLRHAARDLVLHQAQVGCHCAIRRGLLDQLPASVALVLRSARAADGHAQQAGFRRRKVWV
jgi:hypothetical protein